MALGVPFTCGDRVSYGDEVLISSGVRIGGNDAYPVGSLVIQDIPSTVIAAGHP
jgi:acetyltransferase-like isoleucine patch superfamily enzyme